MAMRLPTTQKRRSAKDPFPTRSEKGEDRIDETVIDENLESTKYTWGDLCYDEMSTGVYERPEDISKINLLL
jgi:hypothetical protein